MANDYTTSTDAFRDISEGSYTSSDYPQMASFVTAASRLIDLEVGQFAGFFYATTDSVTRFYDGSGEEEQEIGFWASITSVSVAETGGTASSDYTAWGSSDYMTWPYNRTPITKLIIDLNGSKGGWDQWRKAVKVVGIEGYATAVPDAIALAARIQATRWFMRAKQGYQDTGGSVSVGSMTFTGKLELDPDIKALLMPYILELT